MHYFQIPPKRTLYRYSLVCITYCIGQDWQQTKSTLLGRVLAWIYTWPSMGSPSGWSAHRPKGIPGLQGIRMTKVIGFIKSQPYPHPKSRDLILIGLYFWKWFASTFFFKCTPKLSSTACVMLKLQARTDFGVHSFYLWCPYKQVNTFTRNRILLINCLSTLHINPLPIDWLTHRGVLVGTPVSLVPVGRDWAKILPLCGKNPYS